MSEDLTDIIGSLRAKRADHLNSVAVLDEAIEALTRLVSGTRPVNQVDRSGPRQDPGRNGTKSTLKISVPKACLALAKEGPRDWSAEEVVKEYENRGTPLQVADPKNSVFSAMSRLSSQNKLVRTATGRYAAPEFATQLVNGMKDPLGRPFTDTGHVSRFDEAPLTEEVAVT